VNADDRGYVRSDRRSSASISARTMAGTIRSAAGTSAAKRDAHRLHQGTPARARRQGNQPAEANDRTVVKGCGRVGSRLLKGALPVMPLRIANIVIAAAL
jgi:hypothetical protein